MFKFRFLPVSTHKKLHSSEKWLALLWYRIKINGEVHSFFFSSAPKICSNLFFFFQFPPKKIHTLRKIGLLWYRIKINRKVLDPKILFFSGSAPKICLNLPFFFLVSIQIIAHGSKNWFVCYDVKIKINGKVGHIHFFIVQPKKYVPIFFFFQFAPQKIQTLRKICHFVMIQNKN